MAYPTTGISAQKQSEAKASVADLTLPAKVQKRLVSCYFDGLQRISMQMPEMGGDSRSLWVYDTITELRKQLKRENFNFGRQMAAAYVMQIYTMYGMVYTPSLTGLHRNQRGTDNNMRQMLRTADSLYADFAATGYDDLFRLVRLSCMANYYTQLYANIGNSIKGSASYKESPVSHNLYALGIIDGMIREGRTANEVYQIGSVIDGMSFFQAYCTLAQGFAADEEQFDYNTRRLRPHQEFYNNAAVEIGYTPPSVALKPMAADDFEKYMTENIKHKQLLMQLFLDDMKRMGIN